MQGLEFIEYGRKQQNLESEAAKEQPAIYVNREWQWQQEEEEVDSAPRELGFRKLNLELGSGCLNNGEAIIGRGPSPNANEGGVMPIPRKKVAIFVNDGGASMQSLPRQSLAPQFTAVNLEG